MCGRTVLRVGFPVALKSRETLIRSVEKLVTSVLQSLPMLSLTCMSGERSRRRVNSAKPVGTST